MSARLIGELTEWLRSPAASDLTPQERLVLFVVAERSHERTRLMLRHKVDDVQLVDRIAQTTGMARNGALKRVFQSLAKRGLEVRIPVAKGKDGRPVFACEGHSMRFRLPEFPASVELPEGPAEPVDNETEPVDEPVDNPPDQDQTEPQRGADSYRLSTRGVQIRTASEAQRGADSYRPTPSNYTSGPSTSTYPSCQTQSVAEVSETLTPAPATASNPDQRQRRFTFDFRAACALLIGLPPDIQAAAEQKARAELGPTATNEQIRIRTAEIATHKETA